MQTIKFGKWIPDSADLHNPGLASVINAYPSVTSYKPVGALTTTTSALDARCQGALTVRDASENVRQYAGDAAKLYELSSSTWTDRSKGGG